MSKELKNKLIGSKIQNKLGEEIEIVGIVDDEEFSNIIILGNNGKKYGLKTVFDKGIFKFDDELTKLINLEKHCDKVRIETLERLEEERIEQEKDKKKKYKTLPEGMDIDNTICWFRGEYQFLSNMYESPITYKGIHYHCVESAFHSQKDPSRSSEFENLKGVPSKKLGRMVNLRSDWEEVKLGIMEELVRIKFTQNPELQDKLIKTEGKVLVEGNFWNDTYWGICRGRGENHLGKILMNIRKELISKGVSQ